MNVEEVMTYIRDMDIRINQRLDALATQATTQKSYSTDEFAERVGKRPFTVREWCRLGRIHAKKRPGVGRGNSEEWEITHDELERYRNDKLLPLRK